MTEQELRARAAHVRIVLADVDGVMTDGGLYYFDEESCAVRFHVHDGLGLAMARRAGLLAGLVSGRNMPAVRRRAEELGLDEIHLGIADKGAVVAEILARRGLRREQLCYIGDDLIDLPALAAAGFPVAVRDAVDAVRRAAIFVTTRGGGQGAVRETLDLILAARADGDKR